MNEKDRKMAFDVVSISRRRMAEIEYDLLHGDSINVQELVKELIQIANTLLRIGMLLGLPNPARDVISKQWANLDLYEDENDSPLV